MIVWKTNDILEIEIIFSILQIEGMKNMKMAKRILAVILSALIMAIVPLNAFAARTIDTIDYRTGYYDGRL